MSPNFCSRCGAARTPNGKFCQQCGASFNRAAAAPQPPASSSSHTTSAGQVTGSSVRRLLVAGLLVVGLLVGLLGMMASRPSRPPILTNPTPYRTPVGRSTPEPVAAAEATPTPRVPRPTPTRRIPRPTTVPRRPTPTSDVVAVALPAQLPGGWISKSQAGIMIYLFAEDGRFVRQISSSVSQGCSITHHIQDNGRATAGDGTITLDITEGEHLIEDTCGAGSSERRARPAKREQISWRIVDEDGVPTLYLDDIPYRPYRP